jgi:DNA/RNA endonuclease YhcR with UshA esterase domain
MENLVVTDIYTTTSESSSSQGAMTLTCTRDGVTIDVRTTVLYDENNNLITADAYMGKTINVKGIVDYYSGSYQIKVLSANDITIVS